MHAQVAKRGTGLLLGGSLCVILGIAVMFYSLWFILLYTLLFMIAFVLGIIAMTQSRVGPGLALLLASLFVPATLFATLVSIRTKEFKNDVREIAGENRTDSKLELESYSCAPEPTGSIRFILVGEVKNIGPTELHSVLAKGTLYDAKKKVVDTVNQPLDIDPVKPGRTATFKTYGPENPAVNSCSFVFTNSSGSEIATVTK